MAYFWANSAKWSSIARKIWHFEPTKNLTLTISRRKCGQSCRSNDLHKENRPQAGWILMAKTTKMRGGAGTWLDRSTFNQEAESGSAGKLDPGFPIRQHAGAVPPPLSLMILTSLPGSSRLEEPLFCIACHALGLCAILSVAMGWTTGLVQGCAISAVILVALVFGSSSLQRKILQSFREAGRNMLDLLSKILPPRL